MKGFTYCCLKVTRLRECKLEWKLAAEELRDNWRASGLSKQDKNRLEKIMHYNRTFDRTFVASEDDLNLLNKYTSPANTSSAEWNEWYTGLKGKCVSLSRRMFETFIQKETELGIRVVKSRNGHVGAASERCNSILAALENAASEDA